jgi:hypothetical protein
MAIGMHKYSVQEGINTQLGQAGADVVTATTINQTTNSGITWVAITVLTGNTDDGKNSTAAITTTSVDTSIWDSLSTTAVPVGTTIYGRWSIVTAGTGDTIIAYRG